MRVPAPPRDHARAFSLAELLFVLAVVGLLAATAVPAYREVVLRLHRQEARGALLDIARAQERHYLLNGVYAPATALSAPSPAGLGVGGYTESARYALRLDPAPAAGSYLAWAEARGDQLADDSCRALWIDSLGRREALDALGQPSATCWD